MPKVLLVEDDNSLREIFEMRLKAEGYETVTAADGEEGLVVATKEKPDLIVADVMMPKLSGFEMLETLHDAPEMQGVKVIMMTALGQAEDRIKGEKLGVVKYLVKSQVTLEDFIKAISEVLPLNGATPATPVNNSDQPTPAEMTGTPAASAVGSVDINKQESETPMNPTDPMATSTPAPEPTMQPVPTESSEPAPTETPQPAPASDMPMADTPAPAPAMDTPAPAADMSAPAAPAVDASAPAPMNDMPMADSAPSTVVTPTAPTTDSSPLGTQPTEAAEKATMDAQINNFAATPAPAMDTPAPAADMSAPAAPAVDASAPAPAPDTTVSQPSESQTDPSSMAL